MERGAEGMRRKILELKTSRGGEEGDGIGRKKGIVPRRKQGAKRGL